MAIQPQQLTNLICGPFKFIEPTDRRDSSKRVIWKCECVCGAYEYAAKADMLKYAGHGLNCPGHPLKGKELPLDGFTLDPSMRGTSLHDVVLKNWESARRPEPPEENPTSDSTPATSPSVPSSPPEQPKELKDSTDSAKGSNTLKDRLGLDGYRTECITLTAPVAFDGSSADRVVFAKQIDGNDRVFLHVHATDTTGKQSIISSQKKLPSAAWLSLCDTLREMNIDWRERPKRRSTAQ